MNSWNGFQHGVNLGGWLSQCIHTDEHYRSFICEDDIRQLASWGLDHIRVPVDYNLVEDKSGEYREEGFAFIHNAIDWCIKARLHMVLDLHKTYGFSFDVGEQESGFFENEQYQERFYRLWEEFAKRYSKYNEMIAFELLNEVTDKKFKDSWNSIAAKCIQRIRTISPTVDILIGGYYNNSIDALPDLDDPADDHIIYNFHCYDPILFTHQGAPWVHGMDTNFRFSLSNPVVDLKAKTEAFIHHHSDEFSGLPQDKPLTTEYFIQRFQKAYDVATERNVKLYCGEYGVIDRADPQDTLRWYQMIHEAFAKFGIGHAAWSYKQMDFGLSDAHLSDVQASIIQLL